MWKFGLFSSKIETWNNNNTHIYKRKQTLVHSIYSIHKVLKTGFQLSKRQQSSEQFALFIIIQCIFSVLNQKIYWSTAVQKTLLLDVFVKI